MFMSTMESNKVLRVWEVLDTNNNAHRAYKRVLSRPTMLEVAKNVICVLLWLETIIGVKVLEEVSRMESKDTKLSLVVKEADGLYSYLLDGHDSLPEALIQNIPTIVSLCGEGRLVDFKFFKFHKELIMHGVTVIRDTIATLVFNDDLHAMLLRFEDDANSNMVPQAMPAPELMEPFVPLSRTPPEDSRTAFLAFYDGNHDISPQYIKNHFERTYGFTDCIERVEIEKPSTGQAPKHGKIVFMSPEQRKEAMFNDLAANFRIKWHDIWVACYMPPF